jgi:microfibrillar-associated protein 1
MTANPKLSRHRAGKPGAGTAAAASSSSDDDSENSEAEQEEQSKAPPQTQVQKPKQKPAASSFPSSSKGITTGVKDVRLTDTERKKIEDEFETEDEEEEDDDEGDAESGSGSESEEESSEEESSSEDERARVRLKPVFIKKGARKAEADTTVNDVQSTGKSEERKKAEQDAKKRERTDAMIQDQMEKDAAAKAEQTTYWDQETLPQDALDDTDGVDPEAELMAWKLRELRRVKRERDAIIAAEKEREEVERRRNLTADERDAEDQEYLAAQKEEREGRGKMGFLQRYQHKGAFFTDDLKSSGLADRDVMGGRYEDDVQDRAALPEYMQIRDMAKLGRKGKTKYKDMRNEDTGRFGEFGTRRPRNAEGDESMDTRDLDDRFRPDDDRDGGYRASGANASSLGERKRVGDGYDRDGKRARVD